MENIILDTKNGKYAGLYSKGSKYNDIAVVYYHGLGGKSKMVQPLLKEVSEYDFYSMEERGHIDSLQKQSVSVKKHIQDIFNVVEHLKTKYKKIYLCGESMGALFTSLYCYKYNNVDGCFTWSIPFYPKNIMQEKWNKKFVIFSRVFLTFLTGWNYQYNAAIDYPKLTNSKFLIKLYNMGARATNNTSEEIVVWKASLKAKRSLTKKEPKCPLFYWQGDNDIMSSKKIFNKISKNKKVEAKLLSNSKHIILYEDGAKEMFNRIVKVIKSNND